MATFAFKALDLAGSPTKGEMEASDKQTVTSQLRSKGLIVVDIEEKAAANAGDLLARFKRVKPDDLVIASRQLATMAIIRYQRPVIMCDRKTVNFVMAGSSPPKSSKIFSNTGTRKTISASRTMPANVMITPG